jgi:hypothetical protein
MFNFIRKQKKPEIGGKVNGNRANYLHRFKDVDFYPQVTKIIYYHRFIGQAEVLLLSIVVFTSMLYSLLNIVQNVQVSQ